jgi:hypothetical protein
MVGWVKSVGRGAAGDGGRVRRLDPGRWEADVKVIGMAAMLVLAVPAPALAGRTVASTYGWPGEGWSESHQQLAGCGHHKIGGWNAGDRLPCRLHPRIRGIASRRLPLGTLVAVCYRRCALGRVVDRGPYANGASVDVTFGMARAIGMPYSVEIVGVRRLS